jgi:hypothetical protein
MSDPWANFGVQAPVPGSVDPNNAFAMQGSFQSPAPQASSAFPAFDPFAQGGATQFPSDSRTHPPTAPSSGFPGDPFSSSPSVPFAGNYPASFGQAPSQSEQGPHTIGQSNFMAGIVPSPQSGLDGFEF